MKFLILILIPMILMADLEPLKDTPRKLIQIDSSPSPPNTDAHESSFVTTAQIRVNSDKGDNEKLVDFSKLDPSISEKTDIGDKAAPGNPNFACNVNILQSYGFRGQPQASVDRNKQCPSIRRNCCTADDAEVAKEMWETNNIFRVEAWYQTYKFMVNYLLGYAQEADILALNYLDRNDICGDAARTIKGMNIGLTVIKNVQKAFAKSIRTLVNIRTGFYCHLCDYSSQSFILSNSRANSEGSMVISKKTCMRLATDVAPASFYSVTYLKTLVESMSVLVGCKKKLTEVLTISVEANDESMIKSCFEAQNDFSRLACDSFCGSLKFTVPVSAIDGYVQDLYPIFHRIKNFKSSVFTYPQLNVFSVSLDFEEKAVRNNFQDFLKADSRFYVHMGAGSVDFTTFTTSVAEAGGMPVFEVLQDRLFYSYLNCRIVSILANLALLLLII